MQIWFDIFGVYLFGELGELWSKMSKGPCLARWKMAIQSIHDMGQVHLGNHGQEDHVWPDGKWPLPDEKKMHTPGDMGDDLALLDPLLNLLICFHCFQ